jgi:lipid-binding SYLF domain-containing protein
MSAAVALAIVPGGAVFAGHSPAVTIQSATEVLDSIQSIPLKCIPPALLADAQGIAIIPDVIKGGFVVGGRLGHGLVLSRNPDGSWGGPAFVTLGGASVGLQAGIQSTDVILVFKTRASLNRILKGKGKLTLGADAAIAAGPVGRQAEAGTDARLKAEIFSYSRSRGLFAGVSLEGAAILYDADANQAYARNPRPEVVMAAERLKAQVAAGGQRQPVGPPPAIIVPPAGIQPVPLPPPPPPGR